MNNSNAAFTQPARWLHWLIAGLIVLQYVLAETAEDAGSALAELAILAQHKSVGITVLMLAIVRLAWRLKAGAPAWPASMPRWQHLASTLSHCAFYLFLFALPLSGWLLSSAAAYSVSWFNLFVLPDLVAPSEGLEHTLETVHEGMAKALFVLGIVHVGAALKHALIDKDDILERMWSWPAAAAGALIIVAGATLLIPAPAQSPVAEGEHNVQADGTFSPAALPAWIVDYAESSIRFTAEQAGAPFTGTWTDWQADIRMQPGEDDFSAEVVIQTAAVETGDADRDSTLATAEWFDPAAFPTAVFRTNELETLDDGSYAAQATLTIKDRSTPVTFRFTLEESGEMLVLEGQATLDRLALGVGTGEWLDTTWVGAEVVVDVTVRATRF